MKNVLIASALLVACASFAAAAEPISTSTLGSMGLGSMQTLSDNDGLAIRGKGTFAAVAGGSNALYNGSSSTNSYEAGAQWVHKSAFAKGSSLSFAGVIQATYAQDPTGSALNVSIIGGVAGGSAKAFAR